MFKRRATLDSTTQSRPNIPTPILPSPTVESSFTQNILKRVPSLHSNSNSNNSRSSRVKVPSSNTSSETPIISTSTSNINFARPSGDYSSIRSNNNNNNNNNHHHQNNNNNNGNYQESYNNVGGGSSNSNYNSLSRSTSTINTQSYQQVQPLPSNRNANQHRSSSQSIASLYPSSAYTISPPPLPTSIPKSHSLPNIRRVHKLLTCYNLICVGAKLTGKTAFIKTLIRNLSLIKSSHEKDALNRIEAFGNNSNQTLINSGSNKKSEIINLEIVTDAKEKINLSIIDTIGLDVLTGNSIGSVNHEMELERQIDAIMRIIEDRFEESIAAENETFRNASSKVQDSHIHLCLYFIHPSSITLRRSFNPSSPIPTPRNSSEQMPPPPHSSTIPASTETLSMSPLDLRNLRKLSRSCNVLPILARSDELTAVQFSEYKKLIKRELLKAGIRFNPFELNSGILDLALPPSSTSNGIGKPKSIRRGRTPTNSLPPTISPSLPTSTTLSPSIASDLDYLATTSDASDSNSGRIRNTSSVLDQADQGVGSEDEEDDDEEEEILPPVKVIKIRRSSSRGAHSRPKLRNLMNGSGEGEEDEGDESSRKNYAELIPFGLVVPEEFSSAGGEKRFVRVFKYGTLDILNPMHSDFTPLQSALFGTNQMKVLKEATAQEKYEPFRTQVLLARRATRNLMPGVEEAILRDLARI